MIAIYFPSRPQSTEFHRKKRTLLEQEKNKGRKQSQDDGAHSSQGTGSISGSWWIDGVALVSNTASNTVATAHAKEGGVRARRSGIGATTVIWAYFVDCASLLPAAFINTCKNIKINIETQKSVHIQILECIRQGRETFRLPFSFASCWVSENFLTARASD